MMLYYFIILLVFSRSFSLWLGLAWQVNLNHVMECSAAAKLKRLRARMSRDAQKMGQAGLIMSPAQARAGYSSGSYGDDESLVDVGDD